MKKNIIFYLLVISNIVFGQDTLYKGFLPPRMTTVQRDAIPSPTSGLMIYNTTVNCMENWNGSKWVSKCSPTSNITLNCGLVQRIGKLIQGVESASASAFKIPYTGGDGNPHSGEEVNSTGVLGLKAKLAAGNFANGNGTLTYIISGKPTTSGTAKFAVNIGGQQCEITFSVSSPAVNRCSSLTSTQWQVFSNGTTNSFTYCMKVGNNIITSTSTCYSGRFNPVYHGLVVEKQYSYVCIPPPQ